MGCRKGLGQTKWQFEIQFSQYLIGERCKNGGVGMIFVAIEGLGKVRILTVGGILAEHRCARILF